MKSKKTVGTGWRGFVPRGRSAVISLTLVAVAAFVLGGIFSGGGDAGDAMRDGDGHAHAGVSESSAPALWTCSMHPQIQLPKAGKCPLCFMDLIPVETGSAGGELDPNQIRLSATAVALAGIQTTAVTRADAERSLRLVGRLDYDESSVAYITAWVPGRLDKLFIDHTGAVVAEGDPLAEIYSPELIAVREELRQARQAVTGLRETGSAVLKSTAQETLRSAREKLRLYGLSADQITTIEDAVTPSDHLTITAPSSGVVVHKDAKEGMYVATGTRIYTIADLTTLWVRLDAYESDLTWLQYGQQAVFTSPSFPGETFDAVIDFIDPVVDPATRTVDVRGVIDNRDGRLKPGMFVSGVVQSRLDSDGRVASAELAGEAPLLIPATAPLLTGKRAVVYVEVPDDEGAVFEGRMVTLGPRAGDYYLVRDGLVEGERVVTNGAFRIDSELQIQAKPSMMSPQGGAMAGHRHGPSAPDAGPESASDEYSPGATGRLKIGEEAQRALTPVYDAYLDAQMALAEDDLDAARSAYDALTKAISGVDMSLFKSEAHLRWMEISKAFADAAAVGQSAESITGVRDAFFHLSLAAIELHDTFGHAGDDAYFLTYCPMARDHTGAHWLQREDIVWNSFYGASMLHCGEIKQELPAGDTVTE